MEKILSYLKSKMEKIKLQKCEANERKKWTFLQYTFRFNNIPVATPQAVGQMAHLLTILEALKYGSFKTVPDQ